MKTAAESTRLSPPSAKRGLISGLIAAALAAFFTVAPAHAQHTFTLTAPSTVNEGDTATFTVTRTGPADVGVGFLIG